MCRLMKKSGKLKFIVCLMIPSGFCACSQRYFDRKKGDNLSPEQWDQAEFVAASIERKGELYEIKQWR